MDKKILRLTELGTVCSSDGTIEILTNKFLKKLERNYESDRYSVSYNEKDNNFDIKYDGIDYILELDSDTMKNYIEGKYNDITLRLKKITTAELDLNKRKEEELKLKKTEEETAIEREKMVKKIIEDAERGIIPNNEARTIYLNKLKKDRKFSFKKLFNIFKESHEDNEIHRYNVGELIDDNSNGIGEYIFIYGILLAIIVSGIAAIIGDLLNIDSFNVSLLWKLALGGFFLPSAIFLYPVATYFYNLVKNTIIHIKNKKLLKHKIKELTKRLNNSTGNKDFSLEFDKTLKTPIEEKTYEYKDIIYKEISKLVKRLEYINSSDRKVLLSELKSILNEYDKRTKDINNNKEMLTEDNIFRLQNDIVKKIAMVEQKMTTARIKDISEEEKSKERLLLENEMSKYYIDGSELERIQREREENIITIPTGRARTKEYNYRKTLN